LPRSAACRARGSGTRERACPGASCPSASRISLPGCRAPCCVMQAPTLRVLSRAGKRAQAQETRHLPQQHRRERQPLARLGPRRACLAPAWHLPCALRLCFMRLNLPATPLLLRRCTTIGPPCLDRASTPQPGLHTPTGPPFPDRPDLQQLMALITCKALSRSLKHLEIRPSATPFAASQFDISESPSWDGERAAPAAASGAQSRAFMPRGGSASCTRARCRLTSPAASPAPDHPCSLHAASQSTTS
jgi:hypothetical protein